MRLLHGARLQVRQQSAAVVGLDGPREAAEAALS